jgi:hypothetical protein
MLHHAVGFHGSLLFFVLFIALSMERRKASQILRRRMGGLLAPKKHRPGAADVFPSAAWPSYCSDPCFRSILTGGVALSGCSSHLNFFLSVKLHDVKLHGISLIPPDLSGNFCLFVPLYTNENYLE